MSSPRRAATTVTLAVLLLAAGAAAPQRALAQAPAPVLDENPTVVVLQGEARDANTVVPAPVPATAGAGTGAPVVVFSAPFQATYAASVPAAAQAAFQRAMNNWGAVLNSSVPIRIHVEFVALGGPLTLGFASYRTTANFANAPRPNTFYPMALADALAGTDLFPQFFDIEIDFNTATNWYFGTGTPPSGTTDFESAAMHEIGHGLGFAGSMRVNNGVGAWGGTPPFPDIFDHFTTDLQRRRLIDTSVYPNPSTALAQALTSNNVYFDSPQTNTGAGDRPKLYAPATWVQGASYGHLDEATYPAGNPNSLMTPTLLQTEVVHSPGPITLCILEALGWSTVQNCPPGAGGGTGTATVNPTSLETGQTFTASATGVAAPLEPYVLRIGTSEANCPTGAPMGSSMVANASGTITATTRTVPLNQTSGGRWMCWVNANDPSDHTVPVPVTIF